MTKDEFNKQNREWEKEFIHRFRSVVSLELLEDLYKFFRIEDRAIMTEDGLYVQKRINNSEESLNHMSPEVYAMVQYHKNSYANDIRVVFNQLLNTGKEESKTIKNSHK